MTGLAAPASLLPRRALAFAPASPATDKDLDEVRRLYEEGKSFFETNQFEKAADIWTRAYGKVPDDAPGVKNAMVYNIATAQEKAYELDKDIVHLRQAELLLRTWVDIYKKMYSKTPETKAEVATANARIRALQLKIERAENGDQEPPVAAETTEIAPGDIRYGSGAVDGIVWNTGSVAEVDPEAVAENKRLAAASRKTDQLIIAGYVTGSVGLFFLLVGAGGFGGGAAASAASDGGGQAGYGIGYAGVGLGLAGLITGAALLGVGFSRRNKIKARQVRVVPIVGPQTAGLHFGMRF